MSFDRKKIYIRDFWTCKSCGRVVTSGQIAHKIRQDSTAEGKGSIRYVQDWLKNNHPDREFDKKAIKDLFINHPFNVCLVCSPNCNDAQNIFFNPVACETLLERIYRDIVK